MSSDSESQPLPLDPSFYNLQGIELAFFKSQTGIQDDEALRKHILQVQAEAYAIYSYPCIRRLGFTTLKISKHPIYDVVLKLGKQRPDAILLDQGSCFGNDARKVVVDGYPRENVIASDIQPVFWNLGHKLFRSSQESFPVSFISGDIFDPEFLAQNVQPASSLSDIQSFPRAPQLNGVTSLTQLQHHVSAIHASSFFHLFSEEKQHALAHLLASLLSPQPGSIIFGSHIGASDSEEFKDGFIRKSFNGGSMFCHSPSSWEKLWTGDGGVFKPGDVTLSTVAKEVQRRDIIQAAGTLVDRVFLLVWSVTRT